ncbi:HesA/MoeB/ThiF family protein [Thermohalobacter berrensis]|uniref:Molybdopterin biosynthesis protein MoeB n=1 Tax=Thermohalobacter berrensis TaxID=99594 RepID=A0A419SU72_9FIRM|nr:HesA/MoeB/ThiF family protein [Thermohalobacter berrensis]RKD28811.1 molybdopterin biosynthesis protein MoeB [Thermohalobacter berrensis]
MKRYIKNMNMLTKEENDRLGKFKVCVVGCGGLGGYVIEMLARLGIGYLTVVDADKFDETNLNRQILSNTDTLGKSKSITAQERIKLVNPLVEVEPINKRVTKNNCEDIIKGHDVVVDAVDNIDTKIILQDTCSNIDIPLVHGAIGGWYGQVTTIFPEDKTLDILYVSRDKKGIEKELGNPSFTPGLVASIQVSEVLKVLIKRGKPLKRRVLFIDTFEQEYEVIDV